MISLIADTRCICRNQRKPNHDKYFDHAKEFSPTTDSQSVSALGIFEEDNPKKYVIGLSPIVDPQYLSGIGEPRFILERTT